MSILYRILSLILLCFTLFAKTTFDGHEITYNDRLTLYTTVLILIGLAKLEEILSALNEQKNK